MCGIYGFVGLDDKQLLKKMGNAIQYRGPDDDGIYVDNNVSLGHKRLSIIDLKAGKQPIYNGDQSIVTVYNGEIYNFIKIKEDLEKKGYRFYTDTDTEVIVHAYEEYQENCVKLFNGMFAFAIWDSKKKKLFLARDRLGIKPLYYSFVDGTFMFASEMKSLLQYEKINRDINFTALNNFLTFRYVPGKDTILKNINKLEPGTTLTFSDGDFKIARYWNLALSIENKPLAYYSRELRSLLEKSVKLRLMSDVPLGALLSGGIDSSVIVSLMSDYVKEPKTFIVGFENEPDNEFSYAKEVAERYNTDHHEIMIKSESYKLLPEVTWFMDEPLGDLTKIPAYCIYREAKKFVTVLLTGEGADELFGGYEQHKILRATTQKYDRFPTFAKKAFSAIIRNVSKETSLKKLSDYLSSSDGRRRYIELTSMFGKSEKALLYSDKIKGNINSNSDIDCIKENFKKDASLSDQVFLTEVKNWLSNDHLLRADRMTMAHSLEGRVPFLDHNIVELSAKIPFNLKLNGNCEKYILRHCMKDKLPENIFKRKKQRFFTPIDNWFQGEFMDVSQNLILESDLFKDIFNKNYINNLFDYKNKISYKIFLKRNKLLKQYYARQLWLLVSLEIWNKIFIENIDYRKIFK
ncbi:MAG: asparagine synthase (glutamine-hydrolyzing) [Nanoarchaeota archaeon]|nr:asparagine synthase (glutamine-hydrolyzing) [Nanoarchaeota archaeon]